MSPIRNEFHLYEFAIEWRMKHEPKQQQKKDCDFYPRSKFEEFASREFGYAAGVNGHFEVALAVENYAAVDKVYEDIMSKGGKPIVAPITCPWGQRTCYIADPEGNLVEIGSFHMNE